MTQNVINEIKDIVRLKYESLFISQQLSGLPVVLNSIKHIKKVLFSAIKFGSFTSFYQESALKLPENKKSGMQNDDFRFLVCRLPLPADEFPFSVQDPPVPEKTLKRPWLPHRTPGR